MSTENDSLSAMLAQYEAANKPRFEKSKAKEFDLKNYFTIYDLEKNEQSKTKEVRLLPNPKGGSPIVEFWGHTATVGGQKRTFPCLEHEKGTSCPFCEATNGLLATGDEADKKLSKKYSAKRMYIVKLIDRNNEADGVKFWRFNQDYSKAGVFDKIHGAISGLKKNKDLTHATEGRDLSMFINRNQTGIPVVLTITPQDASPVSENAEQAAAWLGDTRTWEDVYSVKNYDYLAIVVTGGEPVWDKDNNCWTDKNKKEASVDTTEGEITMGVENVKNNIQAATETVTNPQSTTPDEEDNDDLPF